MTMMARVRAVLIRGVLVGALLAPPLATADTVAIIGTGRVATALGPRFAELGHEIAELADQENAKLIVIPSHGRTGISRLLLGSVAERVLRLSKCPVLVLRGDSADTASTDPATTSARVG